MRRNFLVTPLFFDKRMLNSYEKSLGERFNSFKEIFEDLNRSILFCFGMIKVFEDVDGSFLIKPTDFLKFLIENDLFFSNNDFKKVFLKVLGIEEGEVFCDDEIGTKLINYVLNFSKDRYFFFTKDVKGNDLLLESFGLVYINRNGKKFYSNVLKFFLEHELFFNLIDIVFLEKYYENFFEVPTYVLDDHNLIKMLESLFFMDEISMKSSFIKLRSIGVLSKDNKITEAGYKIIMHLNLLKVNTIFPISIEFLN